MAADFKSMDEKEKSEWKNWVEFLENAVSDSPHAGDDDAMEFHWNMIRKLGKMIDS